MEKRSIDLQLYIEGRPVPVTSISITDSVNGIAQAQISIPWTENVLAIMDKSHVAVFFRSVYDIDQKQENTPYYLCFDGIILNKTKFKSGVSVGAALQCAGVAYYLKEAKNYFSLGPIEKISEFPGPWWDDTVAAFSGASTYQAGGSVGMSATPGTVSPAYVIRSFAKNAPTYFPWTKGSILGAVLSIIEHICGVSLSNKQKAASNIYFQDAQIRLQILQRIGAYFKDATALDLMDQTDLVRTLNNIITGSGRTTDAFSVIQVILNFISYNTLPLSAAPFLMPEHIKYQIWKKVPESAAKSPGKVTETKTNDTVGKLNSLFSEWGALLDEAAKTTKATSTQIQNKVMDARIAGVQWDEFKKHNAAISKFEQKYSASIINSSTDTDTLKKAEKYSALMESCKFCNVLMSQISEVCYKFPAVKAAIGAQSAKEFSADGDSQVLVDLNNALAALLAVINKAIAALNFKASAGNYTLVDAETKTLGSLYTLLIAPNLFFGNPSTCNTILPKDIIQMQSSSSFVGKPSRMYIQTKLDYFTALGTPPIDPSVRTVMVPEILDDKDNSILKNVISKPATLLPHEYYTGITASIKKLKELFKMKSISRKQDISLEYIKRFANYLFFSEYFANNSLSLTLAYSPQIVVGIPMLIIDIPLHNIDLFATKLSVKIHKVQKSDTSATVKTILKELAAYIPDQYIGIPHQIVHDIDAAGKAVTFVELRYVHSHKESLYLEAMKVKVQTGSKQTSKAYTADAVLIDIESRLGYILNDIVKLTKDELSVFDAAGSVVGAAAAQSLIKAQILANTAELKKHFNAIKSIVAPSGKAVKGYEDAAAEWKALSSFKQSALLEIAKHITTLQSFEESLKAAKSGENYALLAPLFIGKLKHPINMLVKKICGAAYAGIYKTVEYTFEDLIFPPLFDPIYKTDKIHAVYENLAVGTSISRYFDSVCDLKGLSTEEAVTAIALFTIFENSNIPKPDIFKDIYIDDHFQLFYRKFASKEQLGLPFGPAYTETPFFGRAYATADFARELSEFSVPLVDSEKFMNVQESKNNMVAAYLTELKKYEL